MLRLAGLLAIAAVALAAIAAVGPDLGLGEREQFIFYRLLGWERRQVATVASLLAIAASVLCALRVIVRAPPGGAARGGGPWRWMAANVLPGVATTYLALLVAFAGFEAVLRAQVPFAAQRWPISFDPAVGQIFAPGDTLRWTNGFDFWTETPVNALGMLDRPPPPPVAAPGTCRIAFLGDSFVEAAQVPIAQKVQVVLEEKLNRAASQRGIGLRFEAFAIGRTGTGQAHQLEAALSFLGLGVQAPIPSWGLMIAEGKEHILFEPWLIFMPGALLVLLVLAINTLGDGLRDVAAPSTRA